MASETHLNGKDLFLRYAWPCARYRLDNGLISRRDYDELVRIIETNSTPHGELLEHCFPRAAKELRDYAVIQKKKMWQLEVVRRFWRENHTRGGSPVMEGKVKSIHGHRIALDVADRVLMAINLYNLPLAPGDDVFIHQMTVVEKK